LTGIAEVALVAAVIVAGFAMVGSALVLIGALLAVLYGGRNPAAKPGLDWYEQNWEQHHWEERARHTGIAPREGGR
jgi:hypothetical protein